MFENEFISFLTHEKRFSPHTITSYETDLGQFVKFAEERFEITDPGNVDHQVIRSWTAEMMEVGISTRTINRKLSTLRTYFRFLRRQQIMDVDPMSKVQAPKSSKRLPVFVEEKNMQRLFDGSHFTDDFYGKRDELVVTIFYETGIRLSELIALKEQDVDTHSRQLKVLGKRNKERIVPVSADLIKKIEDYKRERNSFLEASGSDFLLVNDKGLKLTPQVVRSKVNRYLREVTTIDKTSPHVLRHTFATHMLNNGASLNAVKEILGHANLSATQVYTHNTIDKLKSIHAQTHPKG